jgi:hypothetical protein
MSNNSNTRRGERINLLLVVIMIALFALDVSSAAAGQSGRRPPKRDPSPPVQPSEPERTVPAPQPKPDEPKLQIMATTFKGSVSTPYYLSDVVIQGCVERLRQALGVVVSRGKDMTRKGAIDSAKGSKEVYVLWLYLESDIGSIQPSATRGDYSFYVSYALFTPGTGKTRTSGQVISRPYRPSVGGLPTPFPVPSGGRSAAEFTLRQAGSDVAERVAHAIGLDLPRSL